MDIIDVSKEQLQEVEIKGHYGVFTEFRVDKSSIPKGVYCYELRHGDDDSFPATLEESVKVNYFGTVLMSEKMEMNKYDGKELDELANKLAVGLIEDMKSKKGIDGAIWKMKEAIAKGKDLLPEVSPALKQRTGRAR